MKIQIFLLILISFLLIFGCTNIGETTDNKLTLRIVDLSNETQCSNNIQNCSVIKLEFENLQTYSTKVSIVSLAVVYEDGESQGAYNVFANLLNDCKEFTQFGGWETTIVPNARKQISVCFPEIDKTRNPTLYFEILKDFERTGIATREGGTKQNHSFKVNDLN
jgi:hypothetical protein